MVVGRYVVPENIEVTIVEALPTFAPEPEVSVPLLRVSKIAEYVSRSSVREIPAFRSQLLVLVVDT